MSLATGAAECRTCDRKLQQRRAETRPPTTACNSAPSWPSPKTAGARRHPRDSQRPRIVGFGFVGIAGRLRSDCRPASTAAWPSSVRRPFESRRPSWSTRRLASRTSGSVKPLRSASSVSAPRLQRPRMVLRSSTTWASGTGKPPGFATLNQLAADLGSRGSRPPGLGITRSNATAHLLAL